MAENPPRTNCSYSTKARWCGRKLRAMLILATLPTFVPQSNQGRRNHGGSGGSEELMPSTKDSYKTTHAKKVEYLADL